MMRPPSPSPRSTKSEAGSKTVGIDATGLHGMTFGIHVYAGRLVEHLLALKTDLSFTIYCRKAVPESFKEINSSVQFRIAPFRNRKFCEQFWLSWEMARGELDVFHATFGAPLYSPFPTILTIHDLFHLRYPERYPRWRRLYSRTAIVRAASFAEAIITPSEATRSDVVSLLEIEPDKVSTIASGVDLKRFRPVEHTEALSILNRHNIAGDYFLHVGGFSPIKNSVRIVEAFALAATDAALQDYKLVFAGKESGLFAATLAVARQLQVEDRIIFTGYVPEGDLPALYSSARALVYPSLIEGFGFPILEAFACRTPVITSNCTSLPEVAGNAAVLVSPASTEELANALIKVARDSELRRGLVERGSERVRAFTWERAASETLRIYERVLTSQGG